MFVCQSRGTGVLPVGNGDLTWVRDGRATLVNALAL